ncbi:uncharacterized protein F4822DRAFT_279017 [Hypoxylon trugodes]|uniref:uncharacterized protein n=1 Tax=Hypoxylon trugodes TaxID=326681 RepID=UPI00219A3F08|nr:uncharacterized protein F4822DRAFT_279017 [Hypoxylon trugodes]KAI1387301.1 hypothetical protein F4822DRAFT_279017 [Hypoxylon trugodes]
METEANAETVNLELFEAGGEEGSDFHVFNISDDHYHRTEALQRTGAIDISCNLKKVVHGAISPDSDRYATLLVLQWGFKPQHNTRRIAEATIELEFTPSADGGDVEVERISFDGSYSLMPTTQSESVTRGAEVSLGASYFADLSIGGKWEKTVDSVSSDAISVNGGMHLVNNIPPYRRVKWTLLENETQKSGIPASLTVAVLVSREDQEKFYCGLGFTCKTDKKTAAQSFFKKIPKDDPIIFQPDPREKGKRPHRNILYGDDELGSVDLEKLSDVTFTTIVTRATKSRE